MGSMGTGTAFDFVTPGYTTPIHGYMGISQVNIAASVSLFA